MLFLMRSIQTWKLAPVEVPLSTPGSESIFFCYLLTARSMLSPMHSGKGGWMIWMDADIRFSASELYEVCLDQPATTSKKLKPYERETLIMQDSKHVHVFFFLKNNMSILNAEHVYFEQPG